MRSKGMQSSFTIEVNKLPSLFKCLPVLADLRSAEKDEHKKRIGSQFKTTADARLHFHSFAPTALPMLLPEAASSA